MAFIVAGYAPRWAVRKFKAMYLTLGSLKRVRQRKFAVLCSVYCVPLSLCLTSDSYYFNVQIESGDINAAISVNGTRTLPGEDVDQALWDLQERTSSFYNSTIFWRRRRVVPIVRDPHCAGHEDEGRPVQGRQ